MTAVLLLVALVLPLCLDTFAVAAALGMTGLTRRQRIRFGLLFAAFEGGMPLIGLLVGAALGRLIGSLADYTAIAALIGLGLFMLLADDEKEEARVQRLRNTTGAAIIGLGISISLDELAIGFTLGLARVPVAAAIILIAAQAFLVSQLGFQVGRKVGERFREGAERLAGIVLIALAAILLISRFVR
jgi:putative Mn2+ efflux pump MntP